MMNPVETGPGETNETLIEVSLSSSVRARENARSPNFVAEYTAEPEIVRLVAGEPLTITNRDVWAQRRLGQASTSRVTLCPVGRPTTSTGRG